MCALISRTWAWTVTCKDRNEGLRPLSALSRPSTLSWLPLPAICHSLGRHPHGHARRGQWATLTADSPRGGPHGCSDTSIVPPRVPPGVPVSDCPVLALGCPLPLGPAPESCPGGRCSKRKAGEEPGCLRRHTRSRPVRKKPLLVLLTCRKATQGPHALCRPCQSGQCGWGPLLRGNEKLLGEGGAEKGSRGGAAEE